MAEAHRPAVASSHPQRRPGSVQRLDSFLVQVNGQELVPAGGVRGDERGVTGGGAAAIGLISLNPPAVSVTVRFQAGPAWGLGGPDPPQTALTRIWPLQLRQDGEGIRVPFRQTSQNTIRDAQGDQGAKSIWGLSSTREGQGQQIEIHQLVGELRRPLWIAAGRKILSLGPSSDCQGTVTPLRIFHTELNQTLPQIVR
jgi:hypothetical protein